MASRGDECDRCNADCPSDDVVALYFQGVLDACEVAQFRAHLDTCDSCRSLVAETGRSESYPEASHGSETLLAERPRAAENKFWVGDVIGGKYRVDELLGTGGMGTVLRGTHVELGRSVAIKVMHAELLTKADGGRRFAHEARAAAALTSQHAARILDIDRLVSGVPYMVMEYLEGRDLHKVLIAEGPMTANRVVDYITQASDAIGEAHGRGIIHRDLKPHNLFLTREGIVKVVDFGLSKALPSSDVHQGFAPAVDTQTRSFVGSPHYMAPEQISKVGRVSVRTDIYGLGATMYELLTGSPPFSAASLLELFESILHHPPTSIRKGRSDVSPYLDSVVLRCLSKDAAARYASVEELGEALSEACAQRKAARAVALALEAEDDVPVTLEPTTRVTHALPVAEEPSSGGHTLPLTFIAKWKEDAASNDPTRILRVGDEAAGAFKFPPVESSVPTRGTAPPAWRTAPTHPTGVPQAQVAQVSRTAHVSHSRNRPWGLALAVLAVLVVLAAGGRACARRIPASVSGHLLKN